MYIVNKYKIHLYALYKKEENQVFVDLFDSVWRRLHIIVISHQCMVLIQKSDICKSLLNLHKIMRKKKH